MSDSVWIGVTVIPHAKAAHAKAFESEELAKEYLEKATEKAEEKEYDVWTNIAKSTVQTED